MPDSAPIGSTSASFHSLLGQLRAATCFEDAASAILGPMLDIAAVALPQGSKPLRAVVHLRQDDGYHRLFGLEYPSRAELHGTGYLASTRVWEWVIDHGITISIDLQSGLSRSSDVANHPLALTDEPTFEPKDRLLDGDASHVHIIPLRNMRGRVMGIITLEARCDEAGGRKDVWESCSKTLDLLANLASPHLEASPLRLLKSSPMTDALLPVIGRATSGLVELLRIFAAQEETVLISGPTGVGKSRLARWCHAHSGRRERCFETLDLATIPTELQLAELFGWKRGAFTGAVKDASGAITRAAGGTLFLDEIQSLSSKAQAGLLRVIEERAYRPLGDEAADKQADVRFIVGTNVDLKAAVRAGKFREDLFYRIHVLPIRLPPLSARLDEVPSWAEYMLMRRHQEGDARGVARFDVKTLQVLSSLPWPGNLRQLDNVVRRVYAIAASERCAMSGDVVVGQRHLDLALACEGEAQGSAVVEVLWRAAKSFVQEAERRQQDANPRLNLEMLDVLRGMGLAAAVIQCGGRDEAFRLLGQESMMKSRNHHRAYRREIERVREFLKLMNAEPDDELRALLDAPEDVG
ncbi:MAG TPA: sigma 54-interacting transcriptional regulator [Polyangium sp.]|nr:sigma 54-interacting transcriptional regulator [Polyangium sp.]